MKRMFFHLLNLLRKSDDKLNSILFVSSVCSNEGVLSLLQRRLKVLTSKRIIAIRS